MQDSGSNTKCCSLADTHYPAGQHTLMCLTGSMD